MMNTLKKLWAAYCKVLKVVAVLYGFICIGCLVSRKFNNAVYNWSAKTTMFFIKFFGRIKMYLNGVDKKTYEEEEKKFNEILSQVIKEHEQQYGTVKLDYLIDDEEEA